MKKPIKIAIGCFAVGVVLVFFGLDLLAMRIWLGNVSRSLLDFGVDFARWAGPIMLVGAFVMLPIVAIRWFLRRPKARPSGA